MTPLATKVAFVTGANGISGNALVEHLIRLPKTEWSVMKPHRKVSTYLLSSFRSKIIITSRTPLKNFWQDHRIEFVALDFLQPVEEIIAKMSPLCSSVTHAFFTSYVHMDDFTRLKEFNAPLFSNFLTAIDTVAAETLQRVCLQTGGKVNLSKPCLGGLVDGNPALWYPSRTDRGASA